MARRRTVCPGRERLRRITLGGRLLRRKLALDFVPLAADFDDVAGDQLAASTGFDFAVHFDLAGLNQELRLPTGLGKRAQFQKLIETQTVGFRLWVRFGQCRGLVVSRCESDTSQHRLRRIFAISAVRLRFLAEQKSRARSGNDFSGMAACTAEALHYSTSKIRRPTYNALTALLIVRMAGHGCQTDPKLLKVVDPAILGCASQNGDTYPSKSKNEQMSLVKPGRYRHYKGNEYSSWAWLGTAKPKRNLSSTGSNTAISAFGCGRSRCSSKRWSSTDRKCLVFSIWAKRQDPDTENLAADTTLGRAAVMDQAGV